MKKEIATPPVTKQDVVQEFRLKTIREAAASVVATRGLAGATIDAIAKKAGVAKGTIYLYFNSREELLSSTTELLFEQVRERLQGVFDLDAGDPRRWIESLLATLLQYFDEYRDFLRLFYEVRAGNVDPLGARTKRRQHPEYLAYIEAMADYLESAMEQGSIRTMNSRRLAFVVSEAISAIIFQRLLDAKPVPLEDDVDLVVSVLLDGLTPRES